MKSPMVENAPFIKDKERYSDLQVLKSGAGFYVGTLYSNEEGFIEPGSRDSFEYFATEHEAQKCLELILKGKIQTRVDP